MADIRSLRERSTENATSRWRRTPRRATGLVGTLKEIASAIVSREPKQMERKTRMKSSKTMMIAGLLVLGLAFDRQFAQAQAAGSLDTTFGVGGTITTTFSG